MTVKEVVIAIENPLHIKKRALSICYGLPNVTLRGYGLTSALKAPNCHKVMPKSFNGAHHNLAMTTPLLQHDMTNQINTQEKSTAPLSAP